MKYFLNLIAFAFLISCKKDEMKFNYSFLSEDEKECFRENFDTKNIEDAAIKQQVVDQHMKFYVKGKLVNKNEGLNHDFMIADGFDSSKVTIWQALQYFSTDPSINPENSKPTSTYSEILLGGGGPSDKFGFNASVVFTPQEVGDFNQSFHKFFNNDKLPMYDAKWCCVDGIPNFELKKGFEISFYIGCLYPHATFSGEKTISQQFWLPADTKSDKLGKILSYERIDNRDHYTYKVKIDISGKLYGFGREVNDQSYFADIEDGELFMIFDQNK